MRIKARWIDSNKQWAVCRLIPHSFLWFKWETEENRYYYIDMPRDTPLGVLKESVQKQMEIENFYLEG